MRGWETLMSQPGREREFSLPPPFYSIQALKVLDDAMRTGKGHLLCAAIQMLVCSRNTFPATLRDPALWASMAPSS